MHIALLLTERLVGRFVSCSLQFDSQLSDPHEPYCNFETCAPHLRFSRLMLASVGRIICLLNMKQVHALLFSSYSAVGARLHTTSNLLRNKLSPSLTNVQLRSLGFSAV